MIDPRTIVLRAVLLFAGSGIGTAACAGATNRVSMDAIPPTAAVVEADPADASLVPRLSEYADHGVERIETYFGAPFSAPVRIRVFSGRVEMDAYMREAWGMEETACWMVGGPKRAR